MTDNELELSGLREIIQGKLSGKLRAFYFLTIFNILMINKGQGILSTPKINILQKMYIF